MQGTVGAEVKESWSGFVLKNCDDKISSDVYERGKLLLITKRKEGLANTKLRIMLSVRTSRYGFTRESLKRTRKAQQSLEAQLRTMLSALVLYDVANTICARKKRFILNVEFTRYNLVTRKLYRKRNAKRNEIYVNNIFVFFWNLAKCLPKEPEWFRALITARSSVNWTAFERVNGIQNRVNAN